MRNKKQTFWRNTRGYAVVEATILFPIMIMIFTGLVLLSMYLPTRALLQRATQCAATAIATEHSDAWLRYDTNDLEYYRENNRIRLGNIYANLLGSFGGSYRDDPDKAEQIVINMKNKGVLQPEGKLKVSYGVVNYMVYKEIVVTATQSIPSPVDFSFVGFPKEIEVTVTSTAVVQNGEEFIRNMDLAVDCTEYLAEKFNLNEIFAGVSELGRKFSNFLGI